MVNGLEADYVNFSLEGDINRLVEAGLGVAAVPSMAMPADDHPLLVSVPLVEPVITRRIGLIRRKGRSLSPAALQIYEFFSEMKGQRRKATASPARKAG